MSDKTLNNMSEIKERATALRKFAKTVRMAFRYAYDDEHSDAAVKLYFYPFSGLFFTDKECESFVYKDQITVNPGKVNWIVNEGGKRLADWIKTLKLGDDKYLTMTVYGMTVLGNHCSVDWHYNVDGDGSLLGIECEKLCQIKR